MSNDFENKDIETEGVGNDRENTNNITEGSKENTQSVQAEKTDNETKGQAVESKEENARVQGQTDSQNNEGTSQDTLKASVNTPSPSQRFSASFTPPYNTQGYGTYHAASAPTPPPQKKKEKKGVGIGLLAIVCAICTVIASVVGAFVGFSLGAVDDLVGNDQPLAILQGKKDVVLTDIPEGSEYSDLTVAQVAALVGESVVEITTTQVQTNTFYGQYITSGAGSGVIFTQDTTAGYIVTNYHVIEGANEINVRVKSGDSYRDYAASYVAGDDGDDIAVIRINKTAGETFVIAAFGDSSQLRVGEQVVAIGNPLGQLGGTVTDGIISALDREIIVDNNTMVLLQTNAAINPGNSGGGLFDTSGLLIGIVNAKQSSEGIEGLGFAIPSNSVKQDVIDILEKGYITGRPTIGVSVTEQTYNTQTLVVVTQASNTSFRQNDIITKLGDVDITSLSVYNSALRSLTIGEPVSVTVYRNRSYVTVNVTVAENTLPY